MTRDTKFALGGVLIASVAFLLGSGIATEDNPAPKIAATRPAGSPAEVYVLQSFYDDLTFVDGVFSSPDEAEAWIEDTHGSFERSGRDGITTYEAGDFTYLVTPYEVDDRG